MARPKGVSEVDRNLWAAFTKDILLLPGKIRLALEPTVAPVSKPESLVATPVKPRGHAAGGLDKSSAKKLANGKIRSGRRLDLHGFTATRAHHAVTGFIQKAYGEDIRCVEIITGKGEVLARELPHWLNAPQLRPLILVTAHPYPANQGSVRILLRRRRG